jgi:hypothetical protein
MEIAEQITDKIEHRNDVAEDLWDTESDNDNYNQLVGRLLFFHALVKSDLVRAIKIHKKIQEFDYEQIQNLEDDDLDNYKCFLEDEEFKGGEYYRRVCQNLKEQYDFRQGALRWTINMLKNEEYKIMSEFILSTDDFYYDKDFNYIVDAWLDLEVVDGGKYIFRRPQEKKN